MITRGMLLGKFMPPHLGHVYLAEFAQGFVDELTIVVCSLEREPIPGARRHAWMEEMFPRARVVHLTEDLPQEPSEHPDFWALWEAALRRMIPQPVTHVFASEPYGAKLAEVLGATFVPVDLGRKAVPISGTEIRRDPWAHKDFLPRVVRPYFLKRVSVFGPESTGKSTLAEGLAQHLGTVWVPEYARIWLEAQGPEHELEPHDFLTLAKGQIASEEALARNAEALLITDTDPLLTVIWSRFLTGACLPEVEKLAMQRTYDLTILTGIDVPWIQDGIRYLPDQREVFFDACEAILREMGRTYIRLEGPQSQRLDRALSEVRTISHWHD